jgi:hypothetical protein
MMMDTKKSSETQYSSTKKDGVISNKTVTFIILPVISSNPTKPKMFIFKLEQKRKG